MGEKDEQTKPARKEQEFLEQMVPAYLKKSHDTLPSPPPPPDEDLFESDQPSVSDPTNTGDQQSGD